MIKVVKSKNQKNASAGSARSRTPGIKVFRWMKRKSLATERVFRLLTKAAPFILGTRSNIATVVHPRRLFAARLTSYWLMARPKTNGLGRCTTHDWLMRLASAQATLFLFLFFCINDSVQ